MVITSSSQSDVKITDSQIDSIEDQFDGSTSEFRSQYEQEFADSFAQDFTTGTTISGLSFLSSITNRNRTTQKQFDNMAKQQD